MIERDIIEQRIKEHQIQEFVAEQVRRSGYSDAELKRTPLGEKITIYASRPGMVVGRGGSNIKQLTRDLKDKFDLENPQIEVEEVQNVYLDPDIVSEMIALSLERFGSSRFKGIMHRTLENVLGAGALGAEIILSGKLPSARARSWRVYGGYLKKCGEVSISGVRKSQTEAQLKSGIVGIKVSIMPPDIRLPDDVEFYEKTEEVTDKEEKSEKTKSKKETEKKEEKKEKTEKKSDKKKSKKKTKEKSEKEGKEEKSDKETDKKSEKEEKPEKEKSKKDNSEESDKKEKTEESKDDSEKK